MATTRNIQMQYYNGSDYDILYPMSNYQNMTGTKPSYNFSEINGIVSITQGGTGATDSSNALKNLGGVTSAQVNSAINSKIGWQLYTTVYLPVGPFKDSYTVSISPVSTRDYNLLIVCTSGTLKGTTNRSGSNRYHFECAGGSLITLTGYDSLNTVSESITQETLCGYLTTLSLKDTFKDIVFTGETTSGKFVDVKVTKRFVIEVYITKK